MSTYMILADVDEQEFQNPHELATVWADVRSDIEDIGAEVRDTYAAMGGFDFVLIFDVENRDTALQVALITERYGVDTRTIPLFDTDRLGQIVEDV